MGHRFCRLAAAAAILLGLNAAAAADGLFKPLGNMRMAMAAATPAPFAATKRFRDVAVDRTYLEARVAPPGMDQAGDRLASVPGAAAVRLELFEGVTVNLDRDAIEEAFGGGYIWKGSTAGRDAGSADLVIRDGRVTGLVTVGGVAGLGARTFRIDPLGGDAHRITEVDPAQFPGDIVMPVSAPKAEPAAAPDDGPAATNTEITVLVAYTTKANTLAGGDAVAQANLAVTRANTGFERSRVNIRYRLVGTRLISGYDEGTRTYNQVLDDLSNGTSAGVFQPLHAQRDATHADLVSLLIDHNSYCGLAWMVDNPSSATARLGMSVVTIGCIANESFAHELGHNMGLNHDRFVVSSAPPNSAYNFGYVSTAGQFRTIMAYPNQCSTCGRINNFSNPNVSHNGHVTGISAGNPGAADGARRLNENRAGVAAYRGGTTPPPATTSIVAAMTPVARSARVGAPVTAFATVINSGSAAATGCTVRAPGGLPLAFQYRSYNGGTVGSTVNPTVNIAVGGRQDYILTFTASGAMSSNMAMVFDCTNTPAAPSVRGLNTFLMTATTGTPADVISTAVTPDNSGTLTIPVGATRAAALAAINIGTAASLQARISTTAIGGTPVSLPATIRLCRTNPTTGACITGQASAVNFSLSAGQIATFTGFVTATGAIPFDPANRRLFVHFYQGSTPVGSASVALRTSAADQQAALAE